MEFCVCGNMYYIGLSEKDSNSLVHYCRACGNRDHTISTEGVCVINTSYKKSEQQFNHIINKYTKEDPTLPRIYNIPCPNPACACNTDGGEMSESVAAAASPKVPVEIIYIRYDDTNMKYLYMCTLCDTVWKTDDSK